MEEEAEENLEEELLISPPYTNPCIFEGNWPGLVPPDFDAVTIYLDGRVHADLDWQKGRAEAQKAIEAGYALMWDIQLGLFGGLTQPLMNQTQFLSLALSLEHFRDSLWKEFKQHTLGLSLFRGDADFCQGFPWDSTHEQNLQEWLEEIDSEMSCLNLSQLLQHVEGQRLIRLFCRDVAIEYVALLASRLPDSLPKYLYLDASALSTSFINQIQLLNPERFDRLLLALKGHCLPFDAWGWQVPTAQGYSGSLSVGLSSAQNVTIGVCIPPMTFYHSWHYQGMEECFAALQEHACSFKLIAESQLTSQWDGLDYIFYTPAGLSEQGKRKLQGFCAAGGTVISTGDLLGFSHEMHLIDWLNDRSIAKNRVNSHGDY